MLEITLATPPLLRGEDDLGYLLRALRKTFLNQKRTGLSYKEAARALGIREGTVMSRLYRARQQVVRRVEGSA